MTTVDLRFEPQDGLEPPAVHANPRLGGFEWPVLFENREEDETPAMIQFLIGESLEL